MTFKYNNVYINNTETIAGKKEKEGPLGKIFDKTKQDYRLFQLLYQFNKKFARNFW